MRPNTAKKNHPSESMTANSVTVPQPTHIAEDQPQEPSGQFMLREYEFLQSQHDRVLGEGINRLNFLITLTSAVIGSAIIIGSNNTLPSTLLKIIFLCTLLLLSSIGYDIYQYMVTRATQLDKMQRGMNRIRRYFADRDPSIRPYLILPYSDEPTGHLTFRSSVGVRRTSQTFLASTLGLVLGTSYNLVNDSLIWTSIISAIGFSITYLILDIQARNRLWKRLHEATRDSRFPKNTAHSTNERQVDIHSSLPQEQRKENLVRGGDNDALLQDLLKPDGT